MYLVDRPNRLRLARLVRLRYGSTMWYLYLLWSATVHGLHSFLGLSVHYCVLLVEQYKAKGKRSLQYGTGRDSRF